MPIQITKGQIWVGVGGVIEVCYCRGSLVVYVFKDRPGGLIRTKTKSSLQKNFTLKEVDVFEIKHIYGKIGEVTDPDWIKTKWKEGVTPLQLITVNGTPLVPKFARQKLDAEWTEFTTQLHIGGWS